MSYQRMQVIKKGETEKAYVLRGLGEDFIQCLDREVMGVIKTFQMAKYGKIIKNNYGYYSLPRSISTRYLLSYQLEKNGYSISKEITHGKRTK